MLRPRPCKPSARGPSRSVVAVVLAAALTLVAGAAAAGSLEEEALRQLAFSRDELVQGNFERAVSSAESALRLQPTLYEALALKALAYEGLGRLDLAESLLVAYLELAGGTKLLTDAVDALDRVQVARREAWSRSGGGPRRGPPPPEPRKRSTGPAEPASKTLDPGPYRVRVLEALRGGQCAAARAAAIELTAANPEGADGHRLLGDAARCSGAARDALLAYRRFVILGGDPGQVDSLIGALEAQLGRLEVTVQAPEGAPPAQVRLQTSREQLVPDQAADGGFVFEDLPLDSTFQLVVTGRGLEPVSTEIEALSTGETRGVKVAPTYIGLAVVRVGDYPRDACQVTVGSPEGWDEVVPNGEVRVTASGVAAAVTNTSGSVQVPLVVEAGAVTVFDPRPWIPAELTIVGVPTRSTVRLLVEGSDEASVVDEFETPALGGQLDAETGVLLAQPIQVTSLIGGRAQIEVSHPALGTSTGAAVLAAGTVNAATFDWRALPGVAANRARFDAWTVDTGVASKGARAPLGVSIGVMIGGLVGSGALWALAGVQADQTARAQQEWARAQEQGLPAEDQQALRDVFDARGSSRDGLTAAAAAASAVGGTGVVLTLAFGGRAQKVRSGTGGWDPADLPEVTSD